MQYILLTIAFWVATDSSVTIASQSLRPAKVEDESNAVVLHTPEAVRETPGAGRRVFVTPDEYAGTTVHHTLYLPEDWKADGAKLPVIFEYTGNHFPAAGSTGRVEDSGLGFGLSGGRFIWVSLPFISRDGTENAVTWWGDINATVAYAKKHVPAIIEEYNADPNNVFLCGFSRGAIGVNYIGLHDDEIAALWSAFITHDHFDGVREWKNTGWGSPLEKYRPEAVTRLRRVGDRPYLVCQNGSTAATQTFVHSSLSDVANIRFKEVDTKAALGNFPNDFAIHPHTDRWLNKPGRDRDQVWAWIDSVASHRRSSKVLGQLIFEDQFARSESQETKDEPGNEWTTSSDKTAKGYKQVDLRDGAMHIFTHAEANHATSVRHEYRMTDGTIALRFQLHSKRDSLKLNFTDLKCRTVHAGHLFDVVINPDSIVIEDRKTGVMDLEIRKARTAGTLTEAQKAELARKRISFPADVSLNTWHEVYAHVDGDTVFVELDHRPAGEFRSEGFAHPAKSMIRLLVPRTATVDDVRIWKR